MGSSSDEKRIYCSPQYKSQNFLQPTGVIETWIDVSTTDLQYTSRIQFFKDQAGKRNLPKLQKKKKKRIITSFRRSLSEFLTSSRQLVATRNKWGMGNGRIKDKERKKD